jgi:tRNA(adenine34) deaminase
MKIVKFFSLLMLVIINNNIAAAADLKPTATAVAKATYEKDMWQLIQLIKTAKPKAPFAAMIIDNSSNKILCTSVNNQVERDNAINQAEINAIDMCSKQYGKKILWNNVTLITTAAPSVMAMGAIIIRGISNVVYGTSIDYLIAHKWQQIKINPEEIEVRSYYMHKVTIIGGVLAKQTNLLYRNGPPNVSF